MIKRASFVPVSLTKAQSRFLTLIKNIVVTKGALGAQVAKRVKELLKVVVIVFAFLKVAFTNSYAGVIIVAQHLAHHNRATRLENNKKYEVEDLRLNTTTAISCISK